MPSHMNPLNNLFVSLFAVLASILQEIYRFVKMEKEDENDHPFFFKIHLVPLAKHLKP